MSSEEFEKRMEFILEHQAQSAAKIGQLEDIVARFANATLGKFDGVDEKIAALVDSQIRLADAQAVTTENLNRTDENLRSLIAVVDRYFSKEGRNGESR